VVQLSVLAYNLGQSVATAGAAWSLTKPLSVPITFQTCATSPSEEARAFRQGLDPLAVPLEYPDCGGGRPKVPDPADMSKSISCCLSPAAFSCFKPFSHRGHAAAGSSSRRGAYAQPGCRHSHRNSICWPFSLQDSQQYLPHSPPLVTMQPQAGCAHFRELAPTSHLSAEFYRAPWRFNQHFCFADCIAKGV
jgi:hypothetical protein